MSNTNYLAKSDEDDSNINNGINNNNFDIDDKRAYINYCMWKLPSWALLISLCYFMIAFNIRTVEGNSMYMTLPEESIILTSNNTRNIEVGDLVIVDGHVKRVVGCEGDTVKIKDGIVTVNNNVVKLANDKILSTSSNYNIETEVVSGYFILGESEDSLDSKQYGLVSSIDEKVIAEVLNPSVFFKRGE